MIRHILAASPEDLQTEAERISLLDEPDREEAILDLLEEIQFKQELLVWYESESNDFDDDDLEFGTDDDPDTYEREDDDEDSQDSFSW